MAATLYHRPMHPKAIKRADRRFVWTHIVVLTPFVLWCWLGSIRGVSWNSFTCAGLTWLCYLVTLYLMRLYRRRIYRQAMAAHYMLCDDCLYDLREVTTPVCPECEKEFTRSSLRRAWLWESHARRRFRQRWGW